MCVTLDDLEKLLLRLPAPQTLLEKRDLAITLLTFATSRRRSEIAALDLSHLDFSRREFLFIRIAKSKTDQRGVGMNVGVPRLSEQLRRVCAVRAIEDWLDSCGVRVTGKVVGSGPLFRAFSIDGELQDHRIEPRVVAAVLKKLYTKAGFTKEHIKTIGAHSLRRGFITSADAAGSTAAEIMAVTGHRDRRMLDRYTNHDKTKNPPLLRMFDGSHVRRDDSHGRPQCMTPEGASFSSFSTSPGVLIGTGLAVMRDPKASIEESDHGK